MTLLSLVLILIILGFTCWLVLQIPMAPPFPKVIIGVICLFTVIWLLQQFGLVSGNLRLR